MNKGDGQSLVSSQRESTSL